MIEQRLKPKRLRVFTGMAGAVASPGESVLSLPSRLNESGGSRGAHTTRRFFSGGWNTSPPVALRAGPSQVLTTGVRFPSRPRRNYCGRN